MRRIDLIVIHCSATRCDRAFPVTALIRCHRERFGFTGYHYYVTRDGTTVQTRDLPGVAKACPCFDAGAEYKDI